MGAVSSSTGVKLAEESFRFQNLTVVGCVDANKLCGVTRIVFIYLCVCEREHVRESILIAAPNSVANEALLTH